MTDIAVVCGVGASNGLGAAVARRFAKGGLKTVVSGRTKEKLDGVAEEINASGGDAVSMVSDVTSPERMEGLFKGASDLGQVKAVIFNAGNNMMLPFDELTHQQFEDFWRVGCYGAFCTAKAALPVLEASGGGSLIFTGASASMRGRAQFAHFASSKAALRNLAMALAKEYGPRGIHVGHVVVDGVINGERIQTFLPDYLKALGEDGSLNPDEMSEAFWQIHAQPRSAWTFELDLRPFKENW